MLRTAALNEEWDPQAPGAEFRAGLTLPKPVNFDAVSGNRINAFRIELQGVATNGRRVYALPWECSKGL
jgi:hypothetical protein